MRKIKSSIRGMFSIAKRINAFILDAKTKKILMWYIPASIFLSIAPLITNFIFGEVVNRFAASHSIFGTLPLLWVSAILTVWYVLRSFINFGVSRAENNFGQYVTNKTEQQYLKAFSRLDLQDRENPEIQDAISDAQRNYSAVLDLFSTQKFIITSFIALCASMTIIGLLEWWYIIIILVMVLPSIYLNRVRKKKDYKQQKRLNELRRYKGELNSRIGAKETIVHGSTGYFLDLSLSIGMKLNTMALKLRQKFLTIGLFSSIWYLLLLGVLYYHIFQKVESKVIQVGSIFLILSALDQIYQGISTILSKFVDFDDQARKAKDFFMILDFKSSVRDVENPTEVDLSESPTIEFDNVWFKYPGTDNYVLKGVNLKIDKGERLGLVGENGEGKTSLALLMLRFYDPNNGSVRVNGIDVRLIRREALHAISGVVFQDFELFHTRISESIRSSAIYKNNFEDIVRASATAGIDSYIKELPEGYNHKIGKIYKDGTKLSGGQRQKIAIASLLYRDPKLMVLDELTSALSPTAEEEIVTHYETISNGKTCLVICQRYKSLQFVDRVVVLSGGIIAENGTHSELMSKKGIYYQLYTAAQLKAV